MPQQLLPVFAFLHFYEEDVGSHFCNRGMLGILCHAMNIIPFFSQILGLTGILLVLLDLEDRHSMMNPREDKYEGVKYDTQKESFRFVLGKYFI